MRPIVRYCQNWVEEWDANGSTVVILLLDVLVFRFRSAFPLTFRFIIRCRSTAKYSISVMLTKTTSTIDYLATRPTTPPPRT